MKIHEYQDKELLRGLGVPVPLSRVAFSPADVRAAALARGMRLMRDDG